VKLNYCGIKATVASYGLEVAITSHPTFGGVDQNLDPIIAAVTTRDGETSPNTYSAVVLLQCYAGSDRAPRIKGSYEVLDRPGKSKMGIVFSRNNRSIRVR
jgi:hypothetical protein